MGATKVMLQTVQRTSLDLRRRWSSPSVRCWRSV